MEIKKLLKLEMLKNFHRANILFIIISLVWASIRFLQTGSFSKPDFNMIDFNLLCNFFMFFVIFSVYIIFIVNKEIRNKVIIKNIADGLKRGEYFISKAICLIINIFVYIILSILLIAVFFFLQKEAIGNPINYSNLWYIVSFNKIITLFLGFLYFGILAMMYILLVKNSIIAVSIIIGQLVMEYTIYIVYFYINRTSTVTNFLPSALIKNLVKFDNFDWLSCLILTGYIILIGFIVRRKIMKIS